MRVGAPGCFVLTLGILGAVFSGVVQAQVEPNSITANGLVVYYGIVPGAIVRRHPADHSERKMHGGPSGSVDSEHLVVAVFEQTSGQRIENAELSAFVIRGAHRTQRTLEPMRINDATTYGAFFDMPSPGDYRIDLSIRVSGRALPVHARFEHRRR